MSGFSPGAHPPSPTHFTMFNHVILSFGHTVPVPMWLELDFSIQLADIRIYLGPLLALQKAEEIVARPAVQAVQHEGERGHAHDRQQSADSHHRPPGVRTPHTPIRHCRRQVGRIVSKSSCFLIRIQIQLKQIC